MTPGEPATGLDAHLAKDLTAAEIDARRLQVREATLERSACILEPQFSRISPRDLAIAFERHDALQRIVEHETVHLVEQLRWRDTNCSGSRFQAIARRLFGHTVPCAPARTMGGSMAFVDALRALNTLKADQVIEEYAVAGAMAIVFWTEPVPTFDLDVLVLLPQQEGDLISLDSIYRWAETRGYAAQEEHVLVEGLPTQFVPAPNALALEAIDTAAELDYQGVTVRVARPEYLIALYLQPEARTAKRRERAAMLLELPTLNRAQADDILSRYGLSF